MSEKSLLNRAMRVVDAVSIEKEGLRFSQVAQVIDNPSPSTVNKILKELVGTGVLQKSSNGRYVLGQKIYFWGRAMAVQDTPLQVIRRQMRHLQETYQVSVNVFTCTDKTMFCLECYMDPSTPPLYPAGISQSLRLDVQGAVFFIPPDCLSDPGYLEEQALIFDGVTLEDLEKMIEHMRQTGVQDDFSLFYPGLRRFSVPIRQNGKTVMVLGVGIASKRAGDKDLLDRIVTGLTEFSSRIEDAFFNNSRGPDRHIITEVSSVMK